MVSYLIICTSIDFNNIDMLLLKYYSSYIELFLPYIKVIN
jgi:hypothetical protein